MFETKRSTEITELIAISRHFKIDAQVVGEVRPKLGPGPNKVVIESPYGTFEYL